VITILGGTIVMAYGTVYSASKLHYGMLQRVLQAPMHFFDTTPIGRIVNRFAKDVDIIDSILPMLVRFWLNGIFSVLATLVVISYSTPIFIAVIIPIMVFYYLVQVRTTYIDNLYITTYIFNFYWNIISRVLVHTNNFKTLDFGLRNFTSPVRGS